MKNDPFCRLTGLSEDELSLLAGRVAAFLRQGDILFLDGPLGAGKTSFARGLIRDYIGQALEEVPSPTFSLVQCYEPKQSDRVPIWHFDLYRIENGAELVELGLEDGLDYGISLIEWPDHLKGFPGGYPAAEALTIHFGIAGESRRDVALSGGEDWRNRLPANLGGSGQ